MVAFSRTFLALLASSASVQARRSCPGSGGAVKPSTTTLLTSVVTAAEQTIETEALEPSQGGQMDSSAFDKFKPGVKWNICLHNPIKVDDIAALGPADTDVWDIDLGHATEFKNMIPTLKKAGKFIVCYFNGGAVQNWDTDKDDFPKSIIGKSLSDEYEGEEFYVDIRSDEVVKIMKARLDLAAKVGCDAVDPDNVDAFYDNATGFNLKESDYVTYLTKLADYAHSIKTDSGNPLLVGQKNAPEIAPQLVDVLDFAVLEQCRGSSNPDEESWPFCPDFQPYIAAGKPVLQIEYPPSVEESDGTLSAADKEFYCGAKAGDKGFSKVLKWSSPQLDGWTQFCDSDTSFTVPKDDY